MMMAPPKNPKNLGSAGDAGDPSGDGPIEPAPDRKVFEYDLVYRTPTNGDFSRVVRAFDPDDAVGSYLPRSCRLVSCKPTPKV